MSQKDIGLHKEGTPIRKIAPSLLFFLFFCWVIYMADSGGQWIVFDLIHSMPHGDKIGHLFIFGTLTMLVNHALGYGTTPLFTLRIPKGSVLVLLFALLEEFSQLFFPNRTPSLLDILSDFIGISAATLPILLYQWRQRGKARE